MPRTPAQLRASTKWRKTHPEKVKSYAAADTESGKRKQRALKSLLKNKYGLSVEQYNSILQSQDYKCAICGVPQDCVPFQRLCVDHCHTTHVVRGLLCLQCNSALGKFQDSIHVLESAIRYMKGNTNVC